MSVAPVVLYLDHYHLGDVLFLQSLARSFAGAGAAAPPAVIVHGSGEEAERMLEGEGYFTERVGGVLQVGSPEEAALVEQAVRRVNRQVVGLFTDAVMAAVGVLGTDRGLIRRDPEGALVLHRSQWLLDLVYRRVVPVVGAWARTDGGEGGEVPLADVVCTFAAAMGGATVVFFTNTRLPGVMEGRAPRPEVRLAELLAAADRPPVPEPDALRNVVAAGVPVLLTNPTRLVEKGGPSGTRIVP